MLTQSDIIHDAVMYIYLIFVFYVGTERRTEMGFNLHGWQTLCYLHMNFEAAFRRKYYLKYC